MLPEWIQEEIIKLEYPTIEERMGLAIQLAQRNVEENTGGPFGACIFEKNTGILVSVGVNVVVKQNCSLAHAEAIAIMVAQQVCRTYDLSANRLPDMELVTSAQPCIQCFGNIWWSGIKSVVVGATGEDVEEITGFREGPVPICWEDIFNNRYPLYPIFVTKNILRKQACRVLNYYKQNNGLIYNAGSDKR